MGVAYWLGLGKATALALSVPPAQVLSPWTDDSFLERVLVPDLWPVGTPAPMTRGEAMQVPAVARSRHLIAATVARLPLQVLRGPDPIPDQPYWCYGTDGQLGDLTADDRARLGLYTGQSPWQRMLGTVDDLLFCGWSLWLVTRFTAPDQAGRRLPARLVHLPYGSWDVDAQGRFTDLDGRPFPDGAVLLIQGPHEGVLTFGARSIRAAGTLEATAADVAQRPLRFELHQTSELTLSDAERAGIIAATRAALSTNEGILFTNSAIETKTHSMDSAELLIGGRNAAALDVARHMNIPGAIIDATSEGASLTYSTQESRNQQWLDYGLTAYLDAIAAALSMDTVLPAGQRTAFDTSSLTTTLAPVTGPPTKD